MAALALLRPASTNSEELRQFAVDRFLGTSFLGRGPDFSEPNGSDCVVPRLAAGDVSMFDFAKRDLVLWLVALAIAAALMALTANFAFDRFVA
jgi:hypothetical protein